MQRKERMKCITKEKLLDENYFVDNLKHCSSPSYSRFINSNIKDVSKSINFHEWYNRIF